MSLPVIALPTAVVEIEGGHQFTVRGLSRGETLELAGIGEQDIATAECALLAYGLGEDRDAVREWYQSVPVAAVKPLVDKIVELSGLEMNAARPMNGGS